MKKHIALFLLLALSLLNGCGFHLRGTSSTPPELQQVYFSTNTPDSPLSTGLRRLLKAMHSNVVKNVAQAPFSIMLSRDKFSYGRPDIVNTTLTSYMNYMQTATIVIINNQTHKIAITKDFSLTQSLTLNVNQIYTTDRNELIQREFSKEMTLLIYYWLISTQTTKALQHATLNKPT